MFVFMEGYSMHVSLVDEVRSVDLGDKRLNRRLAKVVEELGASPNLSIPGATFSRAEMEAAYRFFDNKKVSPERILQPHVDATMARIGECDFVLLVQDTTELDLSRPQQEVKGAGPMDAGKRRGAFHHPLMAFRSDGLPLGTVWQKTWAREKVETTLSPQEKEKKRAETPIEEKESIRWVEGLRAAREVAEAIPETTCVCVGDSEADIYELLSEPRSTSNGKVDLIVRGCHARSTTEGNLFEEVRATPCLYKSSVDVSARTSKVAGTKNKRQQPRDARVAEVEVKAATVTLKPSYRFDRKLPVVTIQVVLIEENNPPENCDPIQWLLITSLPIDDAEQVKKIVQAYCIRWQIEVFFRTIKTGCRIEKRQFESLDRLLNCVALYSIIAWRIMYLCRLGKECPDLSCEVVFEASEWKSVYMAVKRKSPPKKPPRLNEMVRMIASLGGYVVRKSTDPGPQTLWIGLQRTHDMSTAWNAFGPET
jgi:hypothetical protein